jgi:tRNA threonylcarbamoyl adenosine modification protein YeaZ
VITLAIETSTPHGSVAVHNGSALLFSGRFVSDRGHSALLFPLLEQALRTVGNVEQIAVGLGPGSYAGVRIGISAAMGLQLALGAPLVGMPSVATLAGSGAYIAVGDARRETWYWTEVACGECLEGPLLLVESDFRERLLALNKDAAVYTTEPLPSLPNAALAVPEAATLAAFAAINRGIMARDTLEPIYLREPHITKPRGLTG